MNVMIIHGAYGYPEENWFAWLKQELHRLGIDCQVPPLPTPHGQDLKKWLAIMDSYSNHFIHDKTVLIGHSLGAACILRWLERHACQLSAVILVGAFINSVGNEKFDSINQSFFTAPFAWQQIRKCTQAFVCYYGTQDPYVTRNEFDLIANQLRAKKIIISNAAHFNIASGYSRFPHLLWYLKQHWALTQKT